MHEFVNSNGWRTGNSDILKLMTSCWVEAGSGGGGLESDEMEPGAEPRPGTEETVVTCCQKRG